MKILLAIPSKNRIKIMEDNAFSWLRETYGLDWKIFVEPQDFAEYSHSFGFENIVDIQANDRGLGYAKGFISEYAKTNGYDLIFKLDDDIRGFTDFRKKMKPVGVGRYMSALIPQLVKCFEQNADLGAVAFPYSFEMYDRFLFQRTKRIQTAYIVRTELMYLNPKVSVFEDFAAGLHILTKGKQVMRYGMIGIDMGVKVGGGTGGHQSFDRKEQAIREVEELRKIYPPLGFRAVSKPWAIEPDLKTVIL